MTNGVISLKNKKGKKRGGGGEGFLERMSKANVSIGLIIVGIILLVVGLYLLSSGNTSAGYPVLITGVLTGGVGGYLMYSLQSKKEPAKVKVNSPPVPEPIEESESE